MWFDLVLKDLQTSTGYFSMYNIITGLEGSPLLFNYTDFINEKSTRNALHVGNRQFNLMGVKAADKIQPKFMSSVKSLLEELLESGLFKILSFVGNLDVVTNHIGVNKVMDNLNWNGAKGFRVRKRVIWNNKFREVLGYIKSHKNLTSVIIRKASHGCGVDQPEAVWKLVRAFVERNKLL